MSRLAATAAIAALSVGCVHGPIVTHLTYPTAPALAEPAPASGAGPSVAISPLADARRAGDRRIGSAPGGFGKPDVAVLTADDVPAWAALALRTELERLGVRVVEGAVSPGTPVLGGEVRWVHCDTLFTYSGTVTLRAWVDDGDRPRPLERTYEGRGSGGFNWSPSQEQYERCLADALHDAAARIAADVKQVAAGGTPSPAPKPEAAGPWRTTLGFALAEGMFAGLSALAARWPEQTGWTIAVVAPLGALNSQTPMSGPQIAGASGGVAAIGLWNALELRGRRYSRTERFWLNMGGWQAYTVMNVLLGLAFEPQQPAPRASVSVGLAGSAPALLVAGRY